MSVQVPPHPPWVADLDSTLEPSRQAILDTPVIVDASENQLIDGQIQNFLVGFYPIIRDFPQWLQMLLDRSPEMGKSFFTDNIRVERRHDAMWRAMGDGFTVPKKRFQTPEPMRSEEHTSELQSPCNLVCRLLLEKKKNHTTHTPLLAAVSPTTTVFMTLMHSTTSYTAYIAH